MRTFLFFCFFVLHHKLRLLVANIYLYIVGVFCVVLFPSRGPLGGNLREGTFLFPRVFCVRGEVLTDP